MSLKPIEFAQVSHAKSKTAFLDFSSDHWSSVTRAVNSIRIMNNRIFPTPPAALAALSRAVDEAANDDIDIDMNKRSLAILDVDGAGYVATLLPVESQSARRHRRAACRSAPRKRPKCSASARQPCALTYSIFSPRPTRRGQADLVRLLRNSTPPGLLLGH
jgi:hypothetical protein